ncbi:Rha family transcriptional regulator [Pseudomonas sp. A1437]|uniref:Rha family transcriptional regulator n=1 Tax=unclassified Pseudomonas TaxID=196821 RepID=UPI003784ACCC
MSELILNDADFQQMVMADQGKVVTTSLRVAAYFGRAHKAVLRKIANMKCSPEFNRRNFALVEYLDAKGEQRPMYEMTKDGFMFVAMGLTGEKADQIKERFIDAFNWMADQLLQRAMSYDHIRNELMLEYRQEKGIASLAGRTLQRWQIKKPAIETKIMTIERDGQYRLFSA